MFCVYKHTSPNGKVYIGITKDNPQNRWRSGKGYYQNVHFIGAINKYGWDNFKHEILFYGLTKKEACQKEIELIAKYKSNDPKYGYNHSIGGECPALGSKHSEETKEKMSEMRKGKNCYWYGKQRDEETIKKIREAKTGTKWSAKRRAAEKNRKPVSKETREKISNAGMGNQYAVRHKVLCIETGIVYNSISEASRKTNITRSTIGRVCEGKKYYKTAGGYHWEYVKE